MRKTSHKPIASVTDLAEGLVVIDAPKLPGTGPSIDEIEAEMLEMSHLAADIMYAEDGEVSHETRDMRQVKSAVAHIGRIPGPRDALHLVCSGRYAMWDLIPATLELAGGATINTMHIATLGFSKGNVGEMVAMLDSGAIGRLTLLCSHYFKAQSQGIYELAVNELSKRSNARFISLRTHAKIITLKLTDGRTMVIEASANLRSCKNIEQMSIFGQPHLYDFHTRWIDELAGNWKSQKPDDLPF
ncbi:MAG: hypothetical protein FWD61_03385 [Phycisphaerales bacterium]|nr:hypothetical protein [Phycisphaerales bacterium]